MRRLRTMFGWTMSCPVREYEFHIVLCKLIRDPYKWLQIEPAPNATGMSLCILNVNISSLMFYITSNIGCDYNKLFRLTRFMVVRILQFLLCYNWNVLMKLWVVFAIFTLNNCISISYFCLEIYLELWNLFRALKHDQCWIDFEYFGSSIRLIEMFLRSFLLLDQRWFIKNFRHQKSELRTACIKIGTRTGFVTSLNRMAFSSCYVITNCT